MDGYVEIWENVVGYEGIYEVSSFGRVRTHENKTTFTELHGVRKWKQRILKLDTKSDGTSYVKLWKDGNMKAWLVHRLVVLAFIPKVDGKDCVNHLDGSRLNNTVDNIEWCTHKENNNHAFDNGLMSTAKRLTLIDQRTKQEYDFRSMSSASKFLGKAPSYVSNLVSRGKSSTENYNFIFK